MALGSGNIQIDVSTRVDTDGLVRQVQSAERRIRPINLSLDDRKFRAPLGRISGDLGEFNKSLEASVARTLAFGAAVGVLNSVANAFKAMITTAAEVEKKLMDINVILSLNAQSLQKFSSNLFQVAKNTGQSFEEVSNAAIELSRQGLGAEETLSRINDAMILTRLSGMDAAKSVEALTAAVNGFSSSALNTTQIVNKLASVDAAFAVSTEDLANALARAGSTAQGAKVSFDELLASVTSVQQLTARGGSVIGHAFKSIFTRIQRSGVRDALEGIGVATTDAAGNIRGALDILQDYAGVYQTLSDQQRAYTDELIAGVFQINNLKALVKDLGSSYSIYDRALSQSAGATDEATKRNEKLQKTLSALINEAALNVKELASSLGELVATPAVKNLLEMFNNISGALTKALDPKKGSALIKGLFGTIGRFLSGPGLVMITIAFVKLFKFITTQGVGAMKEVFSLGKAKDKIKETEMKLGQILQNNQKLYQEITSEVLTQEQRERRVLEVIEEQNKAYERQQKMMNSLARSTSIQTAMPGSGSAAKGFIPNYANGLQGAIDSEQQAISAGVGGASKKAKPKVLKNFPVGKGKKETVVANTDEVVVPNYKGGQGSAIFNKDMIGKAGGKPKGAIPVAGGYVPNFARKGSELNANKKKPADAFMSSDIWQSTIADWRPLSLDMVSALGGIGMISAKGKNGTIDKGAMNPFGSDKLGPKVGKKIISEISGSNLNESSRNAILSRISKLGTGKLGVKYENIGSSTFSELGEAKDKDFSGVKGSIDSIIGPYIANATGAVAQKIYGNLFGDEIKANNLVRDVWAQADKSKIVDTDAEGSIFEAAIRLGSKASASTFGSNSGQGNWDFEENSNISSDLKNIFFDKVGYPTIQRADAKRIGSANSATEVLNKAYKSDVFNSRLEEIHKQQYAPLVKAAVAGQKNAAGGFIPNFAKEKKSKAQIKLPGISDVVDASGPLVLYKAMYDSFKQTGYRPLNSEINSQQELAKYGLERATSKDFQRANRLLLEGSADKVKKLNYATIASELSAKGFSTTADNKAVYPLPNANAKGATSKSYEEIIKAIRKFASPNQSGSYGNYDVAISKKTDSEIEDFILKSGFTNQKGASLKSIADILSISKHVKYWRGTQAGAHLKAYQPSGATSKKTKGLQPVKGNPWISNFGLAEYVNESGELLENIKKFKIKNVGSSSPAISGRAINSKFPGIAKGSAQSFQGLNAPQPLTPDQKTNFFATNFKAEIDDLRFHDPNKSEGVLGQNFLQKRLGWNEFDFEKAIGSYPDFSYKQATSAASPLDFDGKNLAEAKYGKGAKSGDPYLIGKLLRHTLGSGKISWGDSRFGTKKQKGGANVNLGSVDLIRALHNGFIPNFALPPGMAEMDSDIERWSTQRGGFTDVPASSDNEDDNRDYKKTSYSKKGGELNLSSFFPESGSFAIGTLFKDVMAKATAGNPYSDVYAGEVVGPRIPKMLVTAKKFLDKKRSGGLKQPPMSIKGNFRPYELFNSLRRNKGVYDAAEQRATESGEEFKPSEKRGPAKVSLSSKYIPKEEQSLMNSLLSLGVSRANMKNIDELGGGFRENERFQLKDLPLFQGGFARGFVPSFSTGSSQLDHFNKASYGRRGTTLDLQAFFPKSGPLAIGTLFKDVMAMANAGTPYTEIKAGQIVGPRIPKMLVTAKDFLDKKRAAGLKQPPMQIDGYMQPWDLLQTMGRNKRWYEAEKGLAEKKGKEFKPSAPGTGIQKASVATKYVPQEEKVLLDSFRKLGLPVDETDPSGGFKEFDRYYLKNLPKFKGGFAGGFIPNFADITLDEYFRKELLGKKFMDLNRMVSTSWQSRSVSGQGMSMAGETSFKNNLFGVIAKTFDAPVNERIGTGWNPIIEKENWSKVDASSKKKLKGLWDKLTNVAPVSPKRESSEEDPDKKLWQDMMTRRGAAGFIPNFVDKEGMGPTVRDQRKSTDRPLSPLQNRWIKAVRGGEDIGKTMGLGKGGTESRATMPQLSKEAQARFEKDLTTGQGIAGEVLGGKIVRISQGVEKVAGLRATQKDIYGDNVRSKLEGAFGADKWDKEGPSNMPGWLSAAIMVSQGNRIVDGHHRWATVYARDAIDDGKLGGLSMKTNKIGLPIQTLLKLTETYSGAKQAGGATGAVDGLIPNFIDEAPEIIDRREPTDRPLSPLQNRWIKAVRGGEDIGKTMGLGKGGTESRATMPQLSKEAQARFEKDLTTGQGIAGEVLGGKIVRISQGVEKVAGLRATQKDIYGDNVRSKLEGAFGADKWDKEGPSNMPGWLSAAIMVSQGNRIVDGHHRWATVYARDAIDDGKLGGLSMKTNKIGLPIQTLLKLTETYSGAKQAGGATGAVDGLIPNFAGMDLSRGIIPNFANSLEDAITREKEVLKSQGSNAEIYVDKDGRVKSSKNPMGLLVANKRDEPRKGSQGVNRALANRMDPKTHGAFGGFIPNYAEGEGGGGGKGIISKLTGGISSMWSAIAKAWKDGTKDLVPMMQDTFSFFTQQWGAAFGQFSEDVFSGGVKPFFLSFTDLLKNSFAATFNTISAFIADESDILRKGGRGAEDTGEGATTAQTHRRDESSEYYLDPTRATTAKQMDHSASARTDFDSDSGSGQLESVATRFKELLSEVMSNFKKEESGDDSGPNEGLEQVNDTAYETADNLTKLSHEVQSATQSLQTGSESPTPSSSEPSQAPTPSGGGGGPPETIDPSDLVGNYNEAISFINSNFNNEEISWDAIKHMVIAAQKMHEELTKLHELKSIDGSQVKEVRKDVSDGIKKGPESRDQSIKMQKAAIESKKALNEESAQIDQKAAAEARQSNKEKKDVQESEADARAKAVADYNQQVEQINKSSKELDLPDEKLAEEIIKLQKEAENLKLKHGVNVDDAMGKGGVKTLDLGEGKEDRVKAKLLAKGDDGAAGSKLIDSSKAAQKALDDQAKANKGVEKSSHSAGMNMFALQMGLQAAETAMRELFPALDGVSVRGTQAGIAAASFVDDGIGMVESALPSLVGKLGPWGKAIQVAAVAIGVASDIYEQFFDAEQLAIKALEKDITKRKEELDVITQNIEKIDKFSDTLGKLSDATKAGKMEEAGNFIQSILEDGRELVSLDPGGFQKLIDTMGDSKAFAEAAKDFKAAAGQGKAMKQLGLDLSEAAKSAFTEIEDNELIFDFQNPFGDIDLSEIEEKMIGMGSNIVENLPDDQISGFNDQMLNLQAQGYTANQIINNMTGLFGELSEEQRKFLEVGGKSAENLVNTAAAQLKYKQAVVKAKEAFQNIAKQMDPVSSKISALGSALLSLGENAQKSFDILNKTGEIESSSRVDAATKTGTVSEIDRIKGLSAGEKENADASATQAMITALKGFAGEAVASQSSGQNILSEDLKASIEKISTGQDSPEDAMKEIAKILEAPDTEENQELKDNAKATLETMQGIHQDQVKGDAERKAQLDANLKALDTQQKEFLRNNIISEDILASFDVITGGKEEAALQAQLKQIQLLESMAGDDPVAREMLAAQKEQVKKSIALVNLTSLGSKLTGKELEGSSVDQIRVAITQGMNDGSVREDNMGSAKVFEKITSNLTNLGAGVQTADDIQAAATVQIEAGALSALTDEMSKIMSDSMAQSLGISQDLANKLGDNTDIKGLASSLIASSSKNEKMQAQFLDAQKAMLTAMKDAASSTDFSKNLDDAAVKLSASAELLEKAANKITDNSASGFIPNFAPENGLTRALTTERGMGARRPVIDSHPSVGTYVRDAATQPNFSAVRRDHPEGLRKATQNSKAIQAASASGFVPNFAPEEKKDNSHKIKGSEPWVEDSTSEGIWDVMKWHPVPGAISYFNKNIGEDVRRNLSSKAKEEVDKKFEADDVKKFLRGEKAGEEENLKEFLKYSSKNYSPEKYQTFWPGSNRIVEEVFEKGYRKYSKQRIDGIVQNTRFEAYDNGLEDTIKHIELVNTRGVNLGIAEQIKKERLTSMRMVYKDEVVNKWRELTNPTDNSGVSESIAAKKPLPEINQGDLGETTTLKGILSEAYAANQPNKKNAILKTPKSMKNTLRLAKGATALEKHLRLMQFGMEGDYIGLAPALMGISAAYKEMPEMGNGKSADFDASKFLINAQVHKKLTEFHAAGKANTIGLPLSVSAPDPNAEGYKGFLASFGTENNAYKSYSLEELKDIERSAEKGNWENEKERPEFSASLAAIKEAVNQAQHAIDFNKGRSSDDFAAYPRWIDEKGEQQGGLGRGIDRGPKGAAEISQEIKDIIEFAGIGISIPLLAGQADIDSKDHPQAGESYMMSLNNAFNQSLPNNIGGSFGMIQKMVDGIDKRFDPDLADISARFDPAIREQSAAEIINKINAQGEKENLEAQKKLEEKLGKEKEKLVSGGKTEEEANAIIAQKKVEIEDVAKEENKQKKEQIDNLIKGIQNGGAPLPGFGDAPIKQKEDERQSESQEIRDNLYLGLLGERAEGLADVKGDDKFALSFNERMDLIKKRIGELNGNGNESIPKLIQQHERLLGLARVHADDKRDLKKARNPRLNPETKARYEEQLAALKEQKQIYSSGENVEALARLYFADRRKPFRTPSSKAPISYNFYQKPEGDYLTDFLKLTKEAEGPVDGGGANLNEENFKKAKEAINGGPSSNIMNAAMIRNQPGNPQGKAFIDLIRRSEFNEAKKIIEDTGMLGGEADEEGNRVGVKNALDKVNLNMLGNMFGKGSPMHFLAGQAFNQVAGIDTGNNTEMANGLAKRLEGVGVPIIDPDAHIFTGNLRIPWGDNFLETTLLEDEDQGLVIRFLTDEMRKKFSELSKKRGVRILEGKTSLIDIVRAQTGASNITKEDALEYPAFQQFRKNVGMEYSYKGNTTAKDINQHLFKNEDVAKQEGVNKAPWQAKYGADQNASNMSKIKKLFYPASEHKKYGLLPSIPNDIVNKIMDNERATDFLRGQNENDPNRAATSIMGIMEHLRVVDSPANEFLDNTRNPFQELQNRVNVSELASNFKTAILKADIAEEGNDGAFNAFFPYGVAKNSGYPNFGKKEPSGKPNLVASFLQAMIGSLEKVEDIDPKIKANNKAQDENNGLFENARGFVPNFSKVAGEIAAAKTAGYKSPVTASQVKSINIPGAGKSTFNTQESVFKAKGMSQPFIVPPASSKAAQPYQKKVKNKFNFDPYKRSADGFVPNFAPGIDSGEFNEAAKRFSESAGIFERFGSTLQEMFSGIDISSFSTASSNILEASKEFGVQSQNLKEAAGKIAGGTTGADGGDTNSIDFRPLTDASSAITEGVSKLSKQLNTPISIDAGEFQTVVDDMKNIQLSVDIPSVNVDVVGVDGAADQIKDAVASEVEGRVRSILQNQKFVTTAQINSWFGTNYS